MDNLCSHAFVIYGHPEASRNWTKTLFSWIEKFFSTGGWTVKQSHTDPALWILTSPDNHLVLLVCYSDDIDAVGELTSDIQYVQEEFHKRFGVTTSSPDFMLGVRRTFSTEGDIRVLEFSMPDYIENTYARFEHLMAKFKIRNNRETPLPEGTLFGPKQPDYDPDPAEQQEYRDLGYLSIVGALLWAMRQCHPELSCHLCMLTSCMSKPSRFAFEAALKVLKWLYEHRFEGIRFTSDGNHEPLMAYDSSHIQFADSKSMYMAVLKLAGGPITIKCSKHDYVLNSTPYSEYVAMSVAVQTNDWFRNIITEIGGSLMKMIEHGTILMGDNEPAVKIATDRKTSAKIKHWKLRYHICREAYEEGITLPIWISTDFNESDTGTKCQNPVAFRRTSQMLKGYAPMYIPTEYNPKRINLNGVPVYITIISTDQSSAGSTSA